MTIDTNDMLNSILASLSRVDYIKTNDIPDIELYMDQVTTFMNSHLKPSKRYTEDKILTKTMINNYAKNALIPPPDKKKYSKEHVLLLIFIYYFKNILSINDINTLLDPLKSKYFKTDSEMDLEKIYEEVFNLERTQVEELKVDIVEKFKKSQTTFPDASEEDSEFLHLFSFICILSFDVYLKKQLIERLIDQLPSSANSKTASEKTGKDKTDKDRKSK